MGKVDQDRGPRDKGPRECRAETMGYKGMNSWGRQAQGLEKFRIGGRVIRAEKNHRYLKVLEIPESLVASKHFGMLIDTIDSHVI